MMRRKNSSVVFLLLCVIVGAVMLSGCNEEQQSTQQGIKIEIKTGSDDGGVIALTDVLPAAFGTTNGGSDQPFMVGLLVSGGGDNLTSRGIYRFDISGYENKSFTFHVKCVEKHGNPGNLEVYVTNDTGSLDTNPSNMTDVSNVWNLVETGEKITTTLPVVGQWVEVEIPVSVVASKVTDKGYIVIMLKLEDETLDSNSDYYSFSTYEYLQGSAKPYLSIS
ncbi:MAG: hypothetical protein DRM99_00195 [Thermoplasmata archaeon]|nr:MAG: hypothetical protein DRM99_00195 [Thermoplasmata archaeon]RLF50992.1 MAG: hypothetical protein DRN24_05680 [Thermoplasmata archaeon]